MAPWRTVAAVVSALSLAATAAAQQPSPGGLELPGRDIVAARVLAPAPQAPAALTLSESVRLALLHSPGIVAGTQRVESALARAQRARGAFDSVFRVSPGIRFEQTQIRPEFYGAEEQNRIGLRVIADDFTLLNRAFRDVFEGATILPPPCPRGFLDFLDPQRGLVTTDLTDPAELALRGIERDVRFRLNLDFLQLPQLSDINDICALGPYDYSQDPLLARYLVGIDFSGGEALEGILRSVDQLRKELFGLYSEISEAIAARARLGLERVGEIPEDQMRRAFSLQASYARTFRNGLGVNADLLLQTDEQAYRDRPLDPAFGGLSIPNSYPSRASVSLLMPLGRGLGATSVTAQERAATLAATAEAARLRHALSDVAFRATLAYLNVIAAQQSAALLQESADRQAELVNLLGEQAEVGDIARMDVDRARARAAQVTTSAARARQDLVRARISLAETIGVEVAPDVAPVATDEFGEIQPLAGATLEAWADTAVARRLDLRAAEQQVAAAAALTAGAVRDLRRVFDLTLTAGLSNRYESPFFKYFEDERFPVYSDFETRPDIDEPVRWYSPRGVYRSITGRWEPFISARFDIEIPFGNNAAEGRVAQAQATERQGRIQADDLRRVIRANVLEAGGALQRAAQAVEARRLAVERNTDALGGAMEQLRAGELTVIDTLTTEEALTRDKIELVRAVLLYHSTLARLRYETGDLVAFADEGAPGERVTFTPSVFTR